MTKKAHRDYQNDYPSVTQCLGVLRKIGLEQWFLSNTREFCNAKSNKGKLIGTQIHMAIQSYIETGTAKIETEYDVEVTNALNSFIKFRKEMPEYKLHKAELPLTSELHKFNGTIDCIGEGIMFDWKTGEAKDKDAPTIYEEWKYQVAAYVFLYNEVNNTAIDRAIIVAVAKDKIAYNIYDMDKQEIEDCFQKAFLPCLSILNYQKHQKQMEKERKINE